MVYEPIIAPLKGLLTILYTYQAPKVLEVRGVLGKI